MHPHLYELDQVNLTMQHNHRDARRANEARLAQGDQPGRLGPIMMRLHTTLDSVQVRFHRGSVERPEPTAPGELAGAQELVVTPAERAATA